MTLVAEANLKRDLRERPIGFQDQFDRSLDSAIRQVAVWRHANGLLERPREVAVRQSCYRGQVVERDGIRELCLDVFADSLERACSQSATHRGNNSHRQIRRA